MASIKRLQQLLDLNVSPKREDVQKFWAVMHDEEWRDGAVEKDTRDIDNE